MAGTNSTAAGMATMRDFIRSARMDGRTVLLSSHLLAEVEQICDRIGIIRHGRLVVEGTMAEIRAGGSAGLVVRVRQEQPALLALQELPAVRSVRRSGDHLEVAADPDQAPEINRVLVRRDIDVLELRPVQHSLEQVFLELTDDSQELTADLDARK